MSIWKMFITRCSGDALYWRSLYFASGWILIFVLFIFVGHFWPISLWVWTLIVLPLCGVGFLMMMRAIIIARGKDVKDETYNVIGSPFRHQSELLVLCFVGALFMPVVKFIRTWFGK